MAQSKSQMETLSQAYDAYKGSNESLGEQEFHNLMHEVATWKLSDSELMKVFKKAASQNGGVINKDQFLKMAPLLNTWSALTLKFKEFDVDGDGFLGKDEIKEVLRDNELDDGRECIASEVIIESVDQNGDDKINLQEFMNSLLTSEWIV